MIWAYKNVFTICKNHGLPERVSRPFNTLVYDGDQRSVGRAKVDNTASGASVATAAVLSLVLANAQACVDGFELDLSA